MTPAYLVSNPPTLLFPPKSVNPTCTFSLTQTPHTTLQTRPRPRPIPTPTPRKTSLKKTMLLLSPLSNSSDYYSTTLSNSTHLSPFPKSTLPKPTFPSRRSPTSPFPHNSHLLTIQTTTIFPRKPRWRICLSVSQPSSTSSSSSSEVEVEMVKNRDGVWTAKQKKVVLLWDLDNKPPRGPPYQAAMALRHVAGSFGEIVDMAAYANRHAFIHLPNWVVQERRQRRHNDALERRGLIEPPDAPYVCGVCGRKCGTRLDLKKHFKQLHERERQKKVARMRMLRGKKRQRYKERFISGNHKYEEAARELLTPRIGYGLATELRRAGVYVKTVADKPQAADWALKRQMQHSMSRGIDWLFLVSDDSDFSEMLRRAKESKMRTVVIGDGGQALSRHADIWVPWIKVENGEVDEELLRTLTRPHFDRQFEEDDDAHNEEDGLFSLSIIDDDDEDESDVDIVVDEILVTGSGFNRIRVSAFSEEDLDWDGNGDDGEDYY